MRGFSPPPNITGHIPHDQCTVAGNQGVPLRKCPKREQWAGYRRRGFAGRTERGDFFTLFQLYDLWIDLNNEPVKHITERDL